MKNWKHCTIVGILAVFAITLAFIACDNGNDITHLHNWGDWIITTFPTETSDGIETRICTLDETHTEICPLTLETFQTYFYGTWFGIEDMEDYIITINASSWEIEGSGTSTIFENILWTVTVNNNNPTKNEYPAGYTLTEPQISIPFFINASKDKLCWDGDKNSILTNSADLDPYLPEETAYGDFMYRSSSLAKRLLITKYTGSGGDLIIPETINGIPVTAIGNGAFTSVGVTSITIPATVTSIGGSTFSSCTSLETITFASSSQLQRIGSGAFYNCTSLEEITLPNGLTTIGGSAFAKCTSLVITTLPLSLTYIGTYAFNGCTNINSICLPATVELDESPYQNAFYGCTSLELFTVVGNGPLSVILNGKALVRNNIELLSCPGASGSITLPMEITTISGSAFEDNTNLIEIILPTSITNIATYAFWQCYNLKKVTCLATTPPTLERTNVFSSGQGPLTSLTDIKVPASSVDAYKAATNWNAYADIISAID